MLWHMADCLVLPQVRPRAPNLALDLQDQVDAARPSMRAMARMLDACCLRLSFISVLFDFMHFCMQNRMKLYWD